MNLHEFQAKELLSRNGVCTPEGQVCDTPAAAKAIAEKLFSAGQGMVVVKSQIHAGGRGKGTFKSGYQGGVKLLKTAEAVEDAAKAMLGETLVTKQTGPEGRKVNRILIAGAPAIKKELYLAALLDRVSGRPILMASVEGGVDIEEVAETSPEKIIKVVVDPAFGLEAFQARNLAKSLGITGKLIGPAAKLFQGVYDTYANCDASMVEINPLCIVESADGTESLVAVDAKISIDDNALYRHPDIVAMRDLEEEAPLEIEAGKFGLNYIKLDGNIACLVNGAGLAMATMDIIQHFGGKPANFLDVGGGATKEQVKAAFKIILSDPNVKGILVNIFGGIMQCDIIAAGILAAVEETKLDLPLVVRLEGTNVALGKKMIEDSNLSVIGADSLSEAAQKVVKAVA